MEWWANYLVTAVSLVGCFIVALISSRTKRREALNSREVQERVTEHLQGRIEWLECRTTLVAKPAPPPEPAQISEAEVDALLLADPLDWVREGEARAVREWEEARAVPIPMGAQPARRCPIPVVSRPEPLAWGRDSQPLGVTRREALDRLPNLTAEVEVWSAEFVRIKGQRAQADAVLKALRDNPAPPKPRFRRGGPIDRPSKPWPPGAGI